MKRNGRLITLDARNPIDRKIASCYIGSNIVVDNDIIDEVFVLVGVNDQSEKFHLNCFNDTEITIDLDNSKFDVFSAMREELIVVMGGGSGYSFSNADSIDYKLLALNMLAEGVSIELDVEYYSEGSL